MDKYYLRLLGSVSNSRGIDSSIQRTTTSFTCSYPTVQYSRSTEISSSVNRSRDSFDKEGSGGSPCIFNRSRFLFSSLPCIEEDRRNETGHRFVYPQLLYDYSPFQMETNRSIRASILPGMWTTSLDLTDAYFHVPVCHSYRKFLRFVWNKRVYQFRALPFGLSTAPLAFTKLMQVAIAHLHSQAIQIHSYLDDSLIKELSPEKLYLNTDVVIRLLLSLGFLISWKKSDLIPSQDFIFLGEHYLTHQCIVRPPQEKFQNLCSKIHLFLSQKTVTARQFSQLLGLLKFSSRCCSTWSPSHSTSSILSTPTLAPSYTELGVSSSNHSSGIVSSFGLVDFSSKRFERPTSVLSSPKSDSVHRCLQPRLGSLSGRSFSVRSVDSRSFEGTHQHTRNEGSASCPVSFSVPTAEQ
ncbi:unnamed protein product [Mytilus edulis]|uniref:Reverse transcriptase domain-containing protein n=1 Tax=Mytilus edulis TaxID=6550 RepID=A0A8S3VGP0_MYTED|nr:unnamed protein product [Mytilus edulis]